MSSTRTGGRSRPPATRVGSRSRGVRWTVSGRGVAEPPSSRALRLVRAVLGDVTGVVARVALVLVGRVVLLVDDDQAELLDGREHGRARPDRDPRLADAQPAPLVVALAVGERGVQQRDGVAEAGGEPRHGLRRQRDLGHEHDHALVALERPGRRAEIDLGLARTGHAVQQPRLAGRRFDLRAARRSAPP